MLAPDLYKLRTQQPWPLVDSTSWMKFILIPPITFPSAAVLVGQDATRAELPDKTWMQDPKTLYFSAITYNLRQNYCQQIPALLRDTAVHGDCHSPYPIPLWGGDSSVLAEFLDHLDMVWIEGDCRSRGFFVVQSAAFNVSECHVDETSWINANVDNLSILGVDTSRMIFFA